jgi:hypothetical protein
VNTFLKYFTKNNYVTSFILGFIHTLGSYNIYKIDFIPLLGILSIFLFLKLNIKQNFKIFFINIIFFYIGNYCNNYLFIPNEIVWKYGYFSKYLFTFLFSFLLESTFILIFITYFLYNKKILKNKGLFLIILSIIDYYTPELFYSNTYQHSFVYYLKFFPSVEFFGVFFLILLSFSIISFLLYKDRFFLNTIYVLLSLNLISFFLPIKKELSSDEYKFKIIQSKENISFNLTDKENYYYKEFLKTKQDTNFIVYPESALSEWNDNLKNKIQKSLTKKQVMITGVRDQGGLIITKNKVFEIEKEIPFIYNENFLSNPIKNTFQKYFLNQKNKCHEINDLNICVFMCWESIFPTYYENLTDVDFIFVLSGDTKILDNIRKQHNYTNKFTAKSLGSDLIRVSHGGHSSYFEKDGDILFVSRDNKDQAIVLKNKITKKRSKLIYSKFDFWLIICGFIFIFGYYNKED